MCGIVVGGLVVVGGLWVGCGGVVVETFHGVSTSTSSSSTTNIYPHPFLLL